MIIYVRNNKKGPKMELSGIPEHSGAHEVTIYLKLHFEFVP